MVKLSADERARLTRRTIIDIAKRRQRPGSGSAPGNYAGEPFMRWPDLTDVLRDIPWAVVGGVATSRYMPERFTHDLDIGIRSEDAVDVANRLRSAGYMFQSNLSIGGSSWQSPSGIPIDIIEGEESWWPEALDEARTNLNAAGAPVLPLAYLTMMKILSGRPQDTGDVSRMLGAAADEDLDRIRRIVAERAPDLSEDLESLIVVGQLARDEDA
jgi:hypothetical protein